MKKIIIILLSILSLNLFGKESNIHFLNNENIITYFNNNWLTGFVVSFKGDTLKRSDDNNIFLIDSSFYQVATFPIPEEKFFDKFEPKKEKKLLKYYYKYEFEHYEEVLKQKLDSEKEYFTNDNGKQFLLWYYEVPKQLKEKSSSLNENESGKVNRFTFKYNLYLTFASNSYVVMINGSVLENESLEERIKIMKEISNTVRIYAGNIDIDILDKQIKHKIEGTSFIKTDSISGLKYKIPYWLNVMENELYLSGSFPVINNVANSLALSIFHKSKFSSYSEFKNMFLSNEKIIAYESFNCENSMMECFIINYNNYPTQNIFFKYNDFYGWIDFTATLDTYELNLEKFIEFLDGIELE